MSETTIEINDIGIKKLWDIETDSGFEYRYNKVTNNIDLYYENLNDDTYDHYGSISLDMIDIIKSEFR